MGATELGDPPGGAYSPWLQEGMGTFWLPLPGALGGSWVGSVWEGMLSETVRGQNSRTAPSSSLEQTVLSLGHSASLSLGVTCPSQGGRQLPTGPLAGGTYAQYCEAP